MKDIKDMSLEELKKVKNDWFLEATANGNLAKIRTIGRKLGKLQPAAYGPKYLYQEDTMQIFVDDYGGYFTLHYNGKLKVNTHECEKLYVKSEWEGMIDYYYQKAIGIEELKNTQEEKERLKLIDLLS